MNKLLIAIAMFIPATAYGQYYCSQFPDGTSAGWYSQPGEVVIDQPTYSNLVNKNAAADMHEKGLLARIDSLERQLHEEQAKVVILRGGIH